MAERDRQAFLDRPVARGLAAVVLVFCGGLLAAIHRDDFRGPTGSAGPEEPATDTADPAAPCIERRFADIDGMVDDGVVEQEQAALFRERAEAMCRATEGGGAGAPLPKPAA